MTLRAELDVINEFGVHVGEFNNAPISFDHCPEFQNSIECELAASGYKLLERGSGGMEIPPGFFELQLHDHSVSEHTDDITQGVYFGIKVLEIKKVSDSVFTSLPVFTYHGTDKKTSAMFAEDDSIVVFNPRKPHKLDYYGKSVKLALFSVVKAKKSRYR
jgi:hypothetical protein